MHGEGFRRDVPFYGYTSGVQPQQRGGRGNPARHDIRRVPWGEYYPSHKMATPLQRIPQEFRQPEQESGKLKGLYVPSEYSPAHGDVGRYMRERDVRHDMSSHKGRLTDEITPKPETPDLARSILDKSSQAKADQAKSKITTSEQIQLEQEKTELSEQIKQSEAAAAVVKPESNDLLPLTEDELKQVRRQRPQWGQYIGKPSEFSAVYKCTLTKFEGNEVKRRIVVVKASGHREPRTVQTELRILRKVSHPGIIPCLGSPEIPYKDSYVMPLYEACLSDVLLNTSKFMNASEYDFSRVVSTTLKIGDALSYLHRNAIQHNDVRADNILLDGRKEPVLCDFGMASDLGTMGAAHSLFLNFNPYVAPEMFDHVMSVGSIKADIWGLASVMHSMLTKYKGTMFKKWFTKFGVKHCFAQKGMGQVKVHCSLTSGPYMIPATRMFDEVVVKGLSINPCRRQASVQVMVKDVIDIAYGTPIEEAPAGTTKPEKGLDSSSKAAS